ncbi:MAG: DUF3631 domain-containing protein [Pseudonocardiaceae bacterium]
MPPRPKLSDLGEAAADAALHPGAALLDEVAVFLARFVAFPSGAALTAATLWITHAHAIDAAESTPRIAYLSPEPGSGKTRALEVSELLVPHPMHAVNATPAALFRAVKDLASRPTILFDEIDTVFGPKAKENEEIRGLLNAGHRRGAVAYRCVGEGTRQKVEPFPAYAAVALAGLGDLPDTLMSRAVVIRMRRRAPGEHVEPFRHRVHAEEGHQLRDQLADWTTSVAGQLEHAWPVMPPGITDRPADVWEPLLAIADAARGSWPARARKACTELVKAAQSAESGSLGLRLLADLRAVFGDAEALPTETILVRLRELEESPWSDLRGKPLDARGLAGRLRHYQCGPHQYRDEGGAKQRGYSVAGTDKVGGLGDPWSRYLSPCQESGTAGTTGTRDSQPSSEHLPAVPDSGACTGTASPSGTRNGPLTSDVPPVPAVPLMTDGETEARDCTGCGQRLLLATPGRTVCERCRLNEGHRL